MFDIYKESKIRKLNKNIVLPKGEYGFYGAIEYYKQEANKILGGHGWLTDFNTNCMEYQMISEPIRVLYGNGIPHDLGQADEDWEKDLYTGLRSFLELNFPEYTKEDPTIREFDEFSYGVRPEEDRITEEDICKIQDKIKELRKDPKNWTT